MLDNIDKRLLYELDLDCRQSLGQIAKKLRRSKPFVQFRIKRLEEQGIIQGYNAVVDFSRLGYISFRIYFRFKNLTHARQLEVEEFLAKNDAVWWLVTVQAKWDVGYAVILKSPNDFYFYWDELMKEIRPIVKESHISVYTHINQYPKSYLIEKENTYECAFIAAAEKLELPVLEKKVAYALAQDGKAHFMGLSRKFGVAYNTLKRAVNKLEEKDVIQGYRASIDITKIGYRDYKIYLTFRNMARFDDIEVFARKHPNIVNTNRAIGGADFEIEVQAQSFQEFEDILNELRDQFPDMIEYYDFAIAKEQKKMIYWPGRESTNPSNETDTHLPPK